MSDKTLSLKSPTFEAFARNFESRIENFARICRYSLLSKHPLHSTSECLNLSLSDKEPHLDYENVWRISVLVSLWRFSRDFILLMIFLKLWTNCLYSISNFTKLNVVLYCSNLSLSSLLFNSFSLSPIFFCNSVLLHRIENTATLANPHAQESIMNILTLNTNKLE